MELLPEDKSAALSHYYEELLATHKNVISDGFHATKASAMKTILYDLKILNDYTNHVIVVEAINEAEAKRAKLMKKPQVR